MKPLEHGGIAWSPRSWLAAIPFSSPRRRTVDARFRPCARCSAAPQGPFVGISSSPLGKDRQPGRSRFSFLFVRRSRRRAAFSESVAAVLCHRQGREWKFLLLSSDRLIAQLLFRKRILRAKLFLFGIPCYYISPWGMGGL